MALLLFSCLLGFVLVGYGSWRTAQDLAPEVYGAAGVMKFPHGVSMHAIQFLPLLAWALRKLGVAEDSRLRSTTYALAATVAITAFSLFQTFSGRARFDVSWTGLMLLSLTIALVLASIQAALSSRSMSASPNVSTSCVPGLISYTLWNSQDWTLNHGSIRCFAIALGGTTDSMR